MSDAQIIESLMNADSIFIEKTTSKVPKDSFLITKNDINTYFYFGYEVSDEINGRFYNISRKEIYIDRKDNFQIGVENKSLLIKNVIKEKTNVFLTIENGFENIDEIGFVNYYTTDGYFVVYFLGYDNYNALCLKSVVYKCLG